jgi:hypothetical protein
VSDFDKNHTFRYQPLYLIIGDESEKGKLFMWDQEQTMVETLDGAHIFRKDCRRVNPNLSVG